MTGDGSNMLGDILLIAVGLFFILPLIDGITGKRFFAPLYGVTAEDIQTSHEAETDEESEENTAREASKEERRQIQEEAILQYNRLLDSLAEQYRNEINEKKRSVITAKRIATLEKLNRALERLEKLDE